MEIFAEKYYHKNAEDPFVWRNHIQLVRKYAKFLAKIENADEEVVEIAAILHDIGKYKGRKDHNIRSHTLSKKFLQDSKLSIKKQNLILKCILKHSTKESSKANEIEVKVIQCADVLGTLFDNRWQAFSRKNLTKKELFKLYNKSLKKINLNSAMKIARPQIKKLKLKLK